MFWTIVGAILFTFVGIPVIVYILLILLTKRWFRILIGLSIGGFLILIADLIGKDNSSPEWMVLPLMLGLVVIAITVFPFLFREYQKSIEDYQKFKEKEEKRDPKNKALIFWRWLDRHL